eukprot:6004280-Pleurochrysis_carterae.AAC.1
MGRIAGGLGRLDGGLTKRVSVFIGGRIQYHTRHNWTNVPPGPQCLSSSSSPSLAAAGAYTRAVMSEDRHPFAVNNSDRAPTPKEGKRNQAREHKGGRAVAGNKLTMQRRRPSGRNACTGLNCV